jgi:glycosyltransferase involved in cell wall biosynthesis
VTSPLITVIIPTYNSANFVLEAVQSVLDQTYRRFEVIVVDDGSTDDTGVVLHRFRNLIRYLYQENQGPSAARNAGIRAARGEYICFLDADDLWVPEKLELQLKFLEEYPRVGLVFSDEVDLSVQESAHASILGRKQFYSDLVHQRPLQSAFSKLLVENFVLTSTVMARKTCFAEAGLFDESLRVVEDRDLWLRIAAYVPIGCLPLMVGKRREHENNISTNSELNLRSRIKVWNKARYRFPTFTPAQVLNALFADAHLELAHILLDKDERKEARDSLTKSLTYAMSYTFISRSGQEPLPRYRWCFAIGLLPLTFCGWSTARSLWRFANRRFSTF